MVERKSIFVAKNVDVHDMNNIILNRITGETHTNLLTQRWTKMK